jgi:hypothetical protein
MPVSYSGAIFLIAVMAPSVCSFGRVYRVCLARE